MKLNQALVKVFSESDPDGLTVAVNDFLRDSGEATLISMHYAVADGIYSCMIVYTN